MKWEEWRGSLDGRPTMWIKRLLALFGCAIDLHLFVAIDDSDCFHTHPSWAVRIVLRGGYVEELENGVLRAWRAGDIGIVRPSLSHRVDAILGGDPRRDLFGPTALTLWLRGPKVAPIELRGLGWPA